MEQTGHPPVGRMLIKGNKIFQSQRWASEGKLVYFRYILEVFCMASLCLETSWDKQKKRKVVHSVEWSINRSQWI